MPARHLVRKHQPQLLTEAILEAAKKSIPRGKRRLYKLYWSDTLDKLHAGLTSARETIEKNPTTENVQRHNNIKDAFNQEKIVETQKSWNEKISQLNMEKDMIMSKLWNLTKTLEGTGTRCCRTVLEEDCKYDAGKMAANILADFFHEKSTTRLSNKRIQEICKEAKQKLWQQSPQPSMTSAFTSREQNAAIKKLKTKKSSWKRWHHQ